LREHAIQARQNNTWLAMPAFLSLPNIRLTSAQQDTIKLLALVLMVFDHIAYINELSQGWRVPGRLVMPIFSFLIAYNYLHNTRNATRYALRLAIFASISQLPYMWLFQAEIYDLNILATLLCGLLLIMGVDAARQLPGWLRYLVNPLLIVGISAITLFNSYTLLGPLLMLAVYYYLRTPNLLSLFALATALALLNAYWSLYLGFAGLASMFIVYAASRLDAGTLRLPKMLGYWFYPAHMVVLKAYSVFV